jgi:ArsR family transcriptional regulator, arsenate/arsenite/antimonite-responsive transcriptional repressor / arsenate reductase (thioredoxin)
VAFDPPSFLQLVGHPLRWALLGHLTRSDHTVGELTALVEQPQNLVSYHLGKLRSEGLVRVRRSTADRRDSYYAADLEALGAGLAASGRALHPGLGGGGDDDRRPVPPAARVLFVCTGNSARSQMAEGFARERSGGRVTAASAGSHPKALHPLAVEVMRDAHGIDLSGHRAKPLQDVARRRFDVVVTLCDRVKERCDDLPVAPERLHWSIPDPAATDPGGREAFEETAAELDTRVGYLLAALPARRSA